MRDSKKYPVETYTEKETGQRADVILNNGVKTPLWLSLLLSFFIFVFLYIAFDNFKTALLISLLVVIYILSSYIKSFFNVIGTAFSPLVDTTTEAPGEQASKPGAEPLTIAFSLPTVDNGGAYRVSRYVWPITPSKMQELSERTLEGESFTEANYIKGRGKLFTPKEFFNLRDYLIDRELLEKIDPGRKTSGFKWSEDALELMRRVVSENVLQ